MATHINPETAQTKLQEYIEKGLVRGYAASEAMKDEHDNRRDYRAYPSQLLLLPTPAGLTVRLNDGISTADTWQTTTHSHRQMLDRLEYPSRYYDSLVGEFTEDEDTGAVDYWGRDLIAHDLKVLSRHPKVIGKVLLREVKGTVKGVLTASYRILDSSPIMAEFAAGAYKAGMRLTDGAVTETRNHLRFIMPKLYEPVPGEWLVYGAEMLSSDYGRGALAMSFFAMRLICNNGMIGTDMMRKVHLGKRFSDGDQLSAKTHELDTAAVASAAHDLIAGQKFFAEIERTQNLIAAGQSEIDAGAILDRWQRKQRLTKPEADKAKVLYSEVDAIEQLPQQQGTWRLSNVISLMANNADGDRRIDLQEIATEILTATR